MSNNIKANAPNAVVAKATVSFDTAGITTVNTSIIYLVDDPLKSYIPGRDINGITGFEDGKGYYFVAKLAMDLSAYLIPPVPAMTQLATPGSFTATPGNAQNVLDWADVTNATGYVVDRATNVGFTTGVALAIYTGSTSAYTDTGRTNGTQYFYRVKATASGYTDSGYATANATPAAGAVTLLDQTFNATGDFASWTKDPPDLDAGAGVYEIATDGGVNKLHMTANVSQYIDFIKAGLFTVGDQIKVTLTGVTNTTGTLRVYVGGTAHVLANGDSNFTDDTTGRPHGGITIDCTVSTEGYIRGIKVEKL